MTRWRLQQANRPGGASFRRTQHARAKSAHAGGRLSAWWKGLDWMVIRCRLVAGVVILLWAVLWGKAAYLQIIKGEDYAARARRQHLAAETVTFPRGMITDRNGFPMARSVQCRSVHADPTRIDDPDGTAEILSRLLRKPKETLLPLLIRNKRFVWIERHVSDAVAHDIEAARLSGIFLTNEYERVYPYRHLAGQLLGFVGLDGHGLEGLERALDARLEGAHGKQLIQRDARGRRFHVTGSTPVDDTEDVMLTIDLQIQSLAEDVLTSAVAASKAKWGGMLIVDVPTGDILAWAQAPTFNPNRFRQSGPQVYRNRLALDALEPGSTFKPFLMAAAMREGVIDRSSVFDCENGEWITKTITIRDDGRAFGRLPVNRILAESSNIGSAKIGLLLGAPRFRQFLDEVGFGRRVGLPVPESRGILRAPRDWGEADVMSAAFGQSLSVTPVQMAQAYLTLANFGSYRPLNLLMNEGDRLAETGRTVFPKWIAGEVLTVMREVVDNGTGRRASIDGVSIAGKTGTAQKAGRYGTYGQARMASFVGLIPAERPKTLVIIMLDEPEERKYGGQSAAPAFRTVMTRLLAYTGELPDTRSGTPGSDIPLQADARSDAYRTLAGKNARYDATQTGTGHADEPKVMPNLVGLNVHQAVRRCVEHGVVPLLRGNGGIVSRQQPAAGTPIPGQDSGSEFQCTLCLTKDGG